MSGDAHAVATVNGFETLAVNLQALQGLVGGARVDPLRARHRGEIAYPAQQPRSHPRRGARTPRDLARPLAVEFHAEDAGAARHDLLELRGFVELEPQRNAEALAQRPCDQSRARGRADERESR